MIEPAAHLRPGADKKKRLNVELATEFVPQFLAIAISHPGGQLIGGESEWNAAIEIQGR